ncbi:tripartite tricarboxylate transporter permease [Candidatus Pacearchaeota archaeon]|nr:tripartite tricarboxylate transporter permease [Candidatus Pacearchaeota archaeon]
MIQIILAFLLGVIAGTFTGLAPGIHINLVAALILSFHANSPLPFIIFIVAMSITHVFIDFIPSIFLGAPDEDTALSILPGHQLLKQGKGREAVVLALLGALMGVAISIILAYPFAKIVPYIFTHVQPFIPFILIFISAYIILREKEIIIALVVFILAGFLGFFAFNLPVREPLLPLLSGLFGVSGLIINVHERKSLKKQEVTSFKKINIQKKELALSALVGAIVGPLCSFLPAIGSGHASIIGSEIKEHSIRGFLFLNGLMNALIMSLSFVTAYAIGKTRTGSAAAVKELVGTLTTFHLVSIFLTIACASVCAFILGLILSRKFAYIMNKINYRKLGITTLGVLVTVNIIFSNVLGLVVLATGASLGLYAILSGSRRINLMGCLLIPSIIFYL